MVVLLILVFQLTGPASQTALVLVIQAAPHLLFGLISATVWMWFDAANSSALPTLVGQARIVATAAGC